MRIRSTVSAVALLAAIGAGPALADMEAAQRSGSIASSSLRRCRRKSRWPRCNGSSRPPSLSRAWRSTCCRKAFRRTPTNRRSLTKAFEEITGIKVNHQILGEGEVVQAVQTQMQTNRNLYDAYINDSDLIGTHSRLQSAVNLTDWMAGEGKDVTNPGLDLDDFIGKSVHHRPRRQALAVARPAVRQPLLVPQGLVRPAGPEGQVQGQVRLRPRRAGQLVGL